MMSSEKKIGGPTPLAASTITRSTRTRRASQVEEEDEDDEADDERLLEQRVAQRLDRAVDQVGAVVDHLHPHPGRERWLELGEPRLHAVDHVEHVLAAAHT